MKIFTMLFFLLILNISCEEVEDALDCLDCLAAQRTYVNTLEDPNGELYGSEYSSVVSLCDQSRADYLETYWLDNGTSGLKFECD